MPEKEEIRYDYDRAGRLTCIQDPEGSRLRKYEYNGHGQVIREEDGEGKETLYAYNGLGLKVREQVGIRNEDNVTWYRVIRYGYDLQGNKTEEAYGQEKVKENQEPTGTGFGLCTTRESCCMRKGERRAVTTWEADLRQSGSQKKIIIIIRMNS